MHRPSNGRVNIFAPKTTDLFQMYDKIPAKQISTFRNPTEGLWNNTDLSRAFFSHQNMQIIQNGIRSGVYEKSNGRFVISNQDADTLMIIMRAMFLQYAANQPHNIAKQVKQLNQIVLDYAVPQVYSEAIGYNKYVVDISTMYKPIPPPILAKDNDKQLILKPWF